MIVYFGISIILRESRDGEAVLRDRIVYMYYVYLLENQNDKSWYIGETSDLRQRVKQHNSAQGGQTTKRKRDWKLIYYEAYLIKQDAFGRERFLKSGSGRTYLKKQLKHYLAT